MTVKELIEKLHGYNPEIEVWVADESGSFAEIIKIEKSSEDIHIIVDTSF